MKTPVWFESACREIGTRELPDNRGPAIRRYIDMAHVGKEGWPWCAIFTNAMFEKNGIPGTRSAAARSFECSRFFVKLEQPLIGCIVTFWRGHKSSGLGHVGFYNGEKGDYISVVGGNESDMVREEMYPKLAKKFGLVGFYWPKSISIDDYVTGPFLPVVSNRQPLSSSAKVV